MKLIDKDALVAEIERRNKEAYGNEWGWAVKCETYSEIISILDTLEVEEVDLDKEINKYICNNFFGSQTLGFFASRTKEEPNDVDMALCAKHFFELGLNASNPLTWEDIKLILTIGNEIPFMPEEDFFKELLKRFKAQKGEEV